jgi:hypothetical protein
MTKFVIKNPVPTPEEMGRTLGGRIGGESERLVKQRR